MDKTKNKLIITDAKYAGGFLDRSLGLLRGSNSKTLIFKTRFGIHTFFLKEPVDVLVLDHNKQVVKIKQNLRPNRIFFWNPKYFWVLELPCGIIKKHRIDEGDYLRF